MFNLLFLLSQEHIGVFDKSHPNKFSLASTFKVIFLPLGELVAHGYPFLLYQDLHFYTKRKLCVRKTIKLINHTYKISKHFAEVDFVQICVELIIKLISQMINK